jgi:hypothetical protein
MGFQIAGGIPYALFIIQLIYPNNYLLYGASALLGVGAAIIWTAQVVKVVFQDHCHFKSFKQ